MKLLHVAAILGILGVATLILLTACGSADRVSADNSKLAEELTIQGWEGYMPQSVLDAFTAEYNVATRYVAYGVPQEAIEAMRQGESFDVIVLANAEVQIAAGEKLLAELDHRNLANFSHISNKFRDLAFDPKNKYSIPFEWGTTGLLYRTDLVNPPPTKWADLWDPSFAGKIGLWPYEQDAVGIALKSLGYSYNSMDLAEIAEAGERLMELQERVVLLDPLQLTGVTQLQNGEAQIVFGWAFDMQMAEAEGLENITYFLPEEGTMIWMDNLVIPANSPNKYTAELFLNFIMRPEIAAQIANEMYVAVPNEGAYAHIEPEVLNNPLIFPTEAELENAEFYLSAGPAAEAAYDEIWSRFAAGIQ